MKVLLTGIDTVDVTTEVLATENELGTIEVDEVGMDSAPGATTPKQLALRFTRTTNIKC